LILQFYSRTKLATCFRKSKGPAGTIDLEETGGTRPAQLASATGGPSAQTPVGPAAAATGRPRRGTARTAQQSGAAHRGASGLPTQAAQPSQRGRAAQEAADPGRPMTGAQEAQRARPQPNRTCRYFLHISGFIFLQETDINSR